MRPTGFLTQARVKVELSLCAHSMSQYCTHRPHSNGKMDTNRHKPGRRAMVSRNILLLPLGNYNFFPKRIQKYKFKVLKKADEYLPGVGLLLFSNVIQIMVGSTVALVSNMAVLLWPSDYLKTT